MATTNRPDRVIINSYDDPLIPSAANNGFYNRIVNNLQTPMLNVKGIQLTRANFINSSLPLSDWNGQLLFIYARTASATAVPVVTDLHVIRLHPSWFVPNTTGPYTAFVKNKYYNYVSELITDLNLAAAAGGDSATYNPTWIAGDVTFAYSQATRRVTMTGNTASSFYMPIPNDHPLVAAFLANSSAPYQVRMNSANSGNTYATAPVQPYVLNTAFSTTPTMNSRLGFAMSYANRGIFWGSTSVLGCATTTGIPRANAVGVESDSWPILLGAQNLNVYLNVVNGSGLDSQNRKALLASIPIESPPLGVNSYTTSSLTYPALSVGNEIYNLELVMLDEEGNPFNMPQNFNSFFELSVLY